MKLKDKIEELERRVLELEARPIPVYWPIYVYPSIPYTPPHPIPYQPFWQGPTYAATGWGSPLLGAAI
jgi:hypothetical protein